MEHAIDSGSMDLGFGYVASWELFADFDHATP